MEEKIKRAAENRGDRDRGADRGDRGDRDGGGKDGGAKGFQRRRGCRFCGEGPVIDYKDKYLLSNFLTERSKIVPRRISGACARHQRDITLAVKRARHLALVQYSSSQV